MSENIKTYEYFATCGRGLERVLALELRVLGASRIRPLPNGVAFFGSLEDGLRACLWLRTASRVLLIVKRVGARTSEQYYKGLYDIQWENYIPRDGTFSIDARGTNNALRNSQFAAMRAKDAIVDRMRLQVGTRPNVSRERSDVVVNLRVRKEKVTVAIDLSGEPLHRRGYRVPSSAITAPLRESLAAAMLLAGGWTGGTVAIEPGSKDTQFVFDPFCGSGTIAIEAAMIAADRAPGLLRDYWGFSGWLGHNEDLWYDLLDEADERFDKGLATCVELPAPPVLANDVDAASMKIATESAQRAGISKLIAFTTGGVKNFSFPEEYADQRGLLVTNPPYGERLSDIEQLPNLYAALSEAIKRHEAGFSAAVITPDDVAESSIDAALKSNPIERIQTMNGPIPAPIRIWK